MVRCKKNATNSSTVSSQPDQLHWQLLSSFESGTILHMQQEVLEDTAKMSQLYGRYSYRMIHFVHTLLQD